MFVHHFLVSFTAGLQPVELIVFVINLSVCDIKTSSNCYSYYSFSLNLTKLCQCAKNCGTDFRNFDFKKSHLNCFFSVSLSLIW